MTFSRPATNRARRSSFRRPLLFAALLGDYSITVAESQGNG